MADRYLNFTGTAPGRFLTRRLGLPQPSALRRWTPERPQLEGELLHLTAGESAYEKDLASIFARTRLKPTENSSSSRPAAAVLDATGISDTPGLALVHAALHPVVRSVAENGRVVVLGAPLSPSDHHQAAAQQALEGFVRSLGKELGRGRTATLVRMRSAPAAESTLRFLLSPRSAYVSGQVIEVGDAELTAPGDWDRPLSGRTALVTGAARGIGEAVAEVLARDGARVVVLDVPSAQADLVRVADRLGGTALPLDITADDAGERMAAALAPGGLDILVHNAGITRDRKLANMPAERWNPVLDVNLTSVLRTTDALLASGTLNRGGSVVATASIAGIAGNVGQTNYAASKAGIIGLVRSLAPGAYAEHGVTVNAVAPGFIETKMTAAVPLFIREAGRRMNSLAQGGLPVDVAETTAWLAGASSGVNGQVIRVCGQSLLGA
ncbi:3-oxoacyl-ACP reductase [Streptomyces longisporoflavus]|uniref:3-oxoacyl-ACP reductase n=1 Tax=Streptomyces longisporoflavus TaxID=28044 RepID=UPI00167D1ED7|nr:3-oxoacyl-ACP reductase [Streptomyces longisporoflavus]GGV65446.1 3-oxoacyl-ACP reductase [Streptomyces longisporoflavus]